MEQKLIAEPNLVSPMPAVHSSIRGRRSGPPEVEKRSRKYLSLGLTQNAPVLDVPFTRGSYHHHGIGRLEAGETVRALHWFPAASTGILTKMPELAARGTRNE